MSQSRQRSYSHPVEIFPSKQKTMLKDESTENFGKLIGSVSNADKLKAQNEVHQNIEKNHMQNQKYQQYDQQNQQIRQRFFDKLNGTYSQLKLSGSGSSTSRSEDDMSSSALPLDDEVDQFILR